MGLIRKPKHRGPKKTRSPALKRNPQQSAIVKKSFITTPRKPNSAKRKVAKVVIRRTRKVVDIYLEGMSLNKLNPHSMVLVRGKGPRDLPGVNYHAIRGKGDFPPLMNRRKGRSKYGAKRQVDKATELSQKKPKPLYHFQRKKTYRLLNYGFSLHGLSKLRL